MNQVLDSRNGGKRGLLFALMRTSVRVCIYIHIYMDVCVFCVLCSYKVWEGLGGSRGGVLEKWKE